MDIVNEIEKSLTHALKAKGKFKFDGSKFLVQKPTQKQVIANALALLKRKGVTSDPGFKNAWQLQLTLLGFS